MKYEVTAKSPFYCVVLQKAFTIGSIVEIENETRANQLVSVGFLKPVVAKKRATKKKVKQDE